MTFTTAILRATPDDPDGPYPALQLGIAPVDADTTAMDTLDLDVPTPTTAARRSRARRRSGDILPGHCAAAPPGDPDGNASTAYDDKPSARAGFGVYGSQPGNFIYFRERY